MASDDKDSFIVIVVKAEPSGIFPTAPDVIRKRSRPEAAQSVQ